MAAHKPRAAPQRPDKQPAAAQKGRRSRKLRRQATGTLKGRSYPNLNSRTRLVRASDRTRSEVRPKYCAVASQRDEFDHSAEMQNLYIAQLNIARTICGSRTSASGASGRSSCELEQGRVARPFRTAAVILPPDHGFAAGHLGVALRH